MAGKREKNLTNLKEINLIKNTHVGAGDGAGVVVFGARVVVFGARVVVVVGGRVVVVFASGEVVVVVSALFLEEKNINKQRALGY
jgi:hypothetical protein